jgi:uncharacterized protein (DUF305 family)
MGRIAMKRWLRPLAWSIAALALAVGLGACGGDDNGQEAQGPQGTRIDRAFLSGMVPHHESAIEMAKIAQRRGQHPQIRRLAGSIISAQTREIRQIDRIHQRLFGHDVTPDSGAHQALGLSAEEAALGHADSSKLERARPFDRAFIDEMVAHHQGAIRMARVVTAQTKDAEIKRLARAIIDAQAREIRQMNDWRATWYGEPSPAGGVPEPGEKPSGGGHEGGGSEHSGSGPFAH